MKQYKASKQETIAKLQMSEYNCDNSRQQKV